MRTGHIIHEMKACPMGNRNIHVSNPGSVIFVIFEADLGHWVPSPYKPPTDVKYRVGQNILHPRSMNRIPLNYRPPSNGIWGVPHPLGNYISLKSCDIDGKGTVESWMTD